MEAMRRNLLIALVLTLLGPATWAQRMESAAGPDGGKIRFVVAEPQDYDPQKTYPVLLALPEGKTELEGLLDLFDGGLRKARAQGFVVVAPCAKSNESLAAITRQLRLTYRIETQRFYVTGGRRAVQFGRSRPSDLACLLLTADGRDWLEKQVVDGELSLPARVCLQFGQELLTARASCAPSDEVERAIAGVIDDFNDSAAKADGERYFGHFAPKGVFLGTDGSERWTATEFRAWGLKYFERDSAWIFVPQSRNIDVSGDFAWFDEALHSDTYGACRGTGSLRRIDGVWRIAQYSLSVPIPNPLMAEAVAMITGAEKKALGKGITTVIVVRHAEKEKAGRNPGLTTAGKARALRLAKHLAAIKLTAGYATTYRRTQATIQPSCEDDSITLRALNPKIDVAALILSKHRGGTILVGGHSNTVPAILKGLGVATTVKIAEDCYDKLFIVTIDPFGTASCLNLEF